ncbi:MAG: Ig-like domain-containing protein [Prevotella sp.]|nr:Ig-like domain-containing protein [Prevotella sp.]
MQNKTYLTKLLVALLALLPLTATAQETTQLAKWTFNTGYTMADNVYTPNSNDWAQVGWNGFGTLPKILPNEFTGNQTDYYVSAKGTRFWGIMDNNGDKILSLYQDMDPNNITDYTDASQHNQYFEMSFPTTGYKDIDVTFAFTCGDNTARALQLVYSTDNGQTWVDGGAHTGSQYWWVYETNKVRLSANNKESVIVRLIAANDATAQWRMNEMAVSGEAATSFTETYVLTTNVSPAGAGVITRSPSAAEYEAGTEVTLTATANLGYTFKEWQDGEGNSLSTEESYKVTMNAATTVVAAFDEAPLPEGTPVVLADWNMENSEDIATTWFGTGGAPNIAPDTQMGNPDNYLLTAWSDGRYWQLCTGYNNKVLRIENSTANAITDYTDASQHNVYYEIQFPTVGYKDVTVDFACAYGGNAEASLEAVVSTDGGQTWFDAGTYTTMPNWWLYKDNSITLSAANKEKVIVRLVGGNDFASNWNLDYVKVNAVVAAAPVSETVDEQDFTATWPLKDATLQATATTSKDGLFSVASLSWGDKIEPTGLRTDAGVTRQQFQPTEQVGTQDEGAAIVFTLKPKKALTFTPKKLSFNASRVGTNGGKFDVVVISGDQTTTVGTGITPQLAKESPYVSNHEFDLSNIPATDDILTVKIYVMGLATNKQYAFSDVTITGDVAGTLETVSAYTLNVTLGTEGAGKVSTSPVGSEFDEGTMITVSATENFGYHFAAWTDEEGNVVSTDNPYSFEIAANTTLVATYTQNNVYALNVKLEGGANDNLVQFSPVGNYVDGVHYYEEGTDVKLTALNNRILTFTGWENNTTNAERTVKMNETMNLTANFSSADYIVGWDLYYDQPTQNRVADYKADTENAGMLSLRKADGTTNGWLSRGIERGQENGKYAARIWKYLSEEWYFEISFSSKGYENLILSSCLGDDYNTYSVNNVEYSIDGGQTFTKIGTFNPPARGWDGPKEFSLPSDANNQERVYIRWMPDRTSDLIGVTSDYDGTSIAEIFVLADATGAADEQATLVSSNPEQGATGVSANGSVILTFDNKVKAGTGTATLNGEQIAPIISGKSAVFKYSGLKYNTPYTFTMPEGVLLSRGGNAVAAATISFTTMERQQPEARLYDAIVAQDGSGDYETLQAAIDAAPAQRGTPWLIFVKNGQYKEHVDIPKTKPYMHIIGQDRDKAVILNDALSGGDNAVHVSIGATVTVNADNCFFENITLENEYGHVQQAGPQALALNTGGDRIAMNNVALLSYQDTWITTSTSNNRHYIKNSLIEGAVDFIYNSGNVYLDGDTLEINRPSGGYIVAPSHAADVKWGYVFQNNIIRPRPGVNVTDVWLGRPWHNEPKTVFINTQTFVNLPAKGWYNTMGGLPALWAEYNTVDADGNPVDLSQRETYYYYWADAEKTQKVEKFDVKNTLTAEEAAEYTLKNVMGGDDNWQPDLLCEPCDAPVATISGSKISWDAVPYAICYVVTRNGEVVAITTETTADYTSGATYQVQAVNEYGGLSQKATASVSTAIQTVNTSAVVTVPETVYTIDGKRVGQMQRGLNIVRMNDGSVKKIIIK